MDVYIKLYYKPYDKQAQPSLVYWNEHSIRSY